MKPDRKIDLEPFVCAADVMTQLTCSRSFAYEHLRRAARRGPGHRGMLRVALSEWKTYLEAWFAPTAPAVPVYRPKGIVRYSRTPERETPMIPWTMPRRIKAKKP